MAAFAVPYFFVYDPAILGIDVPWTHLVMSFVTAIAGGISASAAIIGYFSVRLALWERLGFGAAAVLFVSANWLTDLAGAVLVAILVFVASRRQGHPVPQEHKTGSHPAPIKPKGDLK